MIQRRVLPVEINMVIWRTPKASDFEQWLIIIVC